MICFKNIFIGDCIGVSLKNYYVRGLNMSIMRPKNEMTEEDIKFQYINPSHRI